MKQTTLAPFWQQGIDHLRRVDVTLSRLIDDYPDCTLSSRHDPFHTLARAIVGQQVSVLSADATWNKLAAIATEKHANINPAFIQSLDEEVLKSCGFSRQKTRYMFNLAEFFLSEKIQDVTFWHGMNDDEVMQHITQVSGIGRWSAEMFLIFCLMRPDVFPLDDIGLQRALLLHYDLPKEKPFPRDAALTLAQPWAPYRSVALMFLWRSIDPSEVTY